MAFITIEDLTGSIECIVFPRIYTMLKPYLYEDSPVCVEGRLSLREDEEPKLVVNQAQHIYEAAQKQSAPVQKADQKLYLRFELGKDYLLERIKGVLKTHKGTVPVCIHIEESRTTAMAPQDLWVQADEALINELNDILGTGNVVLK